MREEKENNRILKIERKLLSTPFQPSTVVINEIFSFFSYCMRQRSYPKVEDLEKDLSVVRGSVELLIVARSVNSIALTTYDMILKIALSEDFSESEARLSQPIIALNPLSGDTKIALNIEIKNECSGLIEKLTKNLQLKVLTIDLEGIPMALNVEKLLCDALPRFGIKASFSNEDMDCLNNILKVHREHIKAITLTMDGSIVIIFPVALVKYPDRIQSYDNLLAFLPRESKDYSLGVLSDAEIKEEFLLKTFEKPQKELCLGEIEARGQLIHYKLKRRKENV